MKNLLFGTDKSLGLFASLVLHSAVFVSGGAIFVTTPQYAVEEGTGGIEVSLTAAPAEPEVSEQEIIAEEAAVLPAVKDPEDISLPQHDIEEKPAPQIKAQEPLKQTLTAQNSPEKGDGSSAVPGKDVTTFYSAGGAQVVAKPDYLRNPAPPYPWEARQKGWFGTVLLKVAVDKEGQPAQVEIEKTSGHAVLDLSAQMTVRRWRFQPARAGSIAFESTVRVPIRFTLEDNP